MEKVELKEKLMAVDHNIKELWDALDDENKKTLSREFFILNRYISNVQGSSSEIQEHYVLTVNEYFNKNWNVLQKEPKLLWMLLCMCNYDGNTTYFHKWIPFNKRTGPGHKRAKFLALLYPTTKLVDIELLADISTDKEIKELAKHYGMDKAEIAKILK